MTKNFSDLGTGRESVGAALDFAWTAEEFTASDMMAKASVTRSTAISAIDTLLSVDILYELPNARATGEYRGGRPARRFALSTNLGVIVGVDAGGAHLTVTVADLRGQTLVTHRSGLDPNQSPAIRRKMILKSLQVAFDEAETPREKTLAICIGVAAPVNRDGISPPHPEGFWERTNPALADALKEWAPVVEVENDAVLAAIAEGEEGSATGCSDYVALLASERFGSGVVVDGHVLHGAHGGVGEGIVFEHVTGAGAAAGIRYAVENEVQTALEKGAIDPGSELGKLVAKEVDLRGILTLAAAGDKDAVAITDRVGESLSKIVGVLGSLYDPSRVIVCGAVAQSIEPVLARARRVLPENLDLPAPQLLASKLGAEVVSRGALITARRAAKEQVVPMLARGRLKTLGGRAGTR